MVRAENPSVRKPPRNGGYVSCSPRAFCIEKCNILRSGSVWILPNIAPATKGDSWIHQILHLPWKLNVQVDCNFIKYCACHEKWHFEVHQILHLPRKHTETICATWMQLHQTLRLPGRVTLEFHQILRLPRKNDTWTAPNIAPASQTECATWVQLHQILRLPRKVYYSFTLLVFYFFILWLYFFLYSTSPWLYHSLTLLFFYSIILWLYFSFALIFLDSSMLLFCYSFTLLFFYSPFLWLYFSYALSFILLFFYSTVLLLCGVVRILEVSQLNFFWFDNAIR